MHALRRTAGPVAPAPALAPTPYPPEQAGLQDVPLSLPLELDTANAVEILVATLLLLLICVVGLSLVIYRCTYLRRRRASSSDRGSPPPPPPNVLGKKDIDAMIPTVSYAAAEVSQASECEICLAGFVEGEGVRVLPRCGHGFHVACVDGWMRTRVTCPYCRAAIIAAPAPTPAAQAMEVMAANGKEVRRCGGF